MTSTLRFIEIFALGTWVGSIIFLSFVVAPGAFGVFGSRDQAGRWSDLRSDGCIGSGSLRG